MADRRAAGTSAALFGAAACVVAGSLALADPPPSTHPRRGHHGRVRSEITGDVEQTMTGFGSCRAFNQAVGAAIARTTVEQINAFLRAH